MKNITQEKLYSIMLETFAFNYANYHSENMQLVTHPIDTVQQCVAVKRIQLERAAHSNKDHRKKLYPHLSNL